MVLNQGLLIVLSGAPLIAPQLLMYNFMHQNSPLIELPVYWLISHSLIALQFATFLMFTFLNPSSQDPCDPGCIIICISQMKKQILRKVT